MNDNDRLMEEGRLPTPEEWERLVREWRDDAAQRVLREKGVHYEDEYDRILDEAVERGKFRQQTRDQSRER
jgi:hypothetical protein